MLINDLQNKAQKSLPKDYKELVIRTEYNSALHDMSSTDPNIYLSAGYYVDMIETLFGKENLKEIKNEYRL